MIGTHVVHLTPYVRSMILERSVAIHVMAHCTLIIHIYKPMGMRETCHGLNTTICIIFFYDEFLLELASIRNVTLNFVIVLEP